MKWLEEWKVFGYYFCKIFFLFPSQTPVGALEMSQFQQHSQTQHEPQGWPAHHAPSTRDFSSVPPAGRIYTPPGSPSLPIIQLHADFPFLLKSSHKMIFLFYHQYPDQPFLANSLSYKAPQSGMQFTGFLSLSN